VDERNDQIAMSKDELVGRFWVERNAFLGYIHRFAFDRGAAEDIFQEACLKFLTSPASFNSFPFAAKYLYRIIFTLSIAHLKSQRRLIYSEKLPEMVCEPEPQWQKEILIKRLHEAAGDLSSRDRQLLAVHLIPGFHLRDKCLMMRLPSSTYRYQVGRVISKLRKRLTTGIRLQTTGYPSQIGGN
jgi:RNA polymerase sigma factor (sigma-70 family)